jgi:hypothetical protein
MGLKGMLRHLRKEARGELVEIRQRDGSVARFTQSDLQDAFLVNTRRLCGENIESHPLSVAIRNAANREPWHDSFFDMVEVGENVEDLSES